ncbi:MAG TPA: C4-dicarboxylate ABC transporter permease [Alphaproteobacteria bacterium]|nr:C4-dicarboxylate ABC transporter permease [Paracoccaceae bacterium]RCL81345.1 MAG: TRAP transporter large permease [SAR116 cluster bacterium]RPH14075.1 MAG: TRAP transporter large permease [Alphaproteobacteria bacterium TMED150]HBQ22219.1 C4-dicarboxylate ABC transporter permease [Alphaproteobacteria bacterium]HCY47629.1 C4-dicarboxylate ABC transporter permease [Alphaproteobacteria bacterium]|tara:strand:- start:1666 stop:3075 length:1410 start_codon:yes stop_codon:yes gene_type:complete
MDISALIAGQPNAIFGVGYSDTSLVGAYVMILLLVLVFMGVRVVFAAGITGLVGLVELIGWTGAASIVGSVPYSKSVSFVLGLLPMFILIGYLAFHAGMTRLLFQAAKTWLGWVPGGLAVATVFAAAGFAAVSGASVATAAVFARVAIPEMLDAGYKKSLAAGVVAAGGTLATLIPPSAILVIYAIIVEESVGALLIAGFLPGVFSAVVYGLIIIVWAKFNPEAGPAIKGFTWSDRIKSLPGLIPIMSVAVIIITAIYGGWATPTEAGALGAMIVLVTAFIHGMRWRALKDALMETSKLVVMIFSLIWGVLIFGRFLGFSAVPEAFADWILSLDADPYLILLCILLGYVVLGMFMDAIGLLLLTLPVVYPAVMALNGGPDVTAAESAFGLNGTQASIWFGIIVVKMAEVCLITPPIGLNCFVVNGVRPDIPLTDIFKGITLFFIADVLTIIGLIMFPGIVTWLPDLMFS